MDCRYRFSAVSPPTDTPKPIPASRVIKKVFWHLFPKGQPRLQAMVVGSVACVIASKVLRITVPFWFKNVIDALAPGSTAAQAAVTVGPFQLGVFGFVAAYGICRITSVLTDEAKTYLFAPVGGYASTMIVTDMFKKLHSLDLNFHLNRQTGVLSKELDRGSRAFWSLSYALLFMVVPTAFEMTLVCGVLQNQAGAVFVGIALVAVVAYVAWTYVITQYRAKFRESYNTAEGKLGGIVVDSLLNYETVKYFVAEKYEEDRIRGAATTMNNHLVRLDQSVALLNFGQQAIFAVAAVGSFYLSTINVLAGTMTVGDLVLIDALLLQLYMPLSFLGMLYREVQQSTQNMQSMLRLADQECAVKDSPDAVPFVHVKGTIEFRNVCFHYNASRPVLNNVSLTIPGGQCVAFVGPSGSGKSTIFRLLYRFFDPTSGEILVDGQALTRLQIADYRGHVGVIPQDTVLFNETVAYNLRYGKQDATDAQLEQCAKDANIHETIVSLSEGYRTVVGERGLKLSGGEKQRVAIARVLLQDLPLLLADEATSALDTKTEGSIMTTLRKVNKGKSRTIVLIAHRLSTVRDADQIFVLGKDGSLVESGTHDQLCSAGGMYAALWQQQQQQELAPSVK